MRKDKSSAKPHVLRDIVQLSLLLLVLLGVNQVYGQQVILPGSQTGTVQELAQDDGYIRISGSNYGYDAEIIEVYLRGDRVDSAMLDEGLVVRYTLENGMLARVDIIGPNNRIQEIITN